MLTCLKLEMSYSAPNLASGSTSLRIRNAVGTVNIALTLYSLIILKPHLKSISTRIERL